MYAPLWRVTLTGGETREYGGLVIANGHNWDPKLPAYPGNFDGLSLHSARYKTPDVLAGKRVLVVGGGNSGCDIAVESAQHAAKTFLSLRRGYHYLPKFLRGKPIDVCGERLLSWGLPLWLRRQITRLLVFWTSGLPEHYGLPRPDHRLLETHPIINSQMLMQTAQLFVGLLTLGVVGLVVDRIFRAILARSMRRYMQSDQLI